MNVHPCEEVQSAIVRLCDALCSWERATSRQSAFVIREQGGFVFRAVDGKPGVPYDIDDELIFALALDGELDVE